MNLYWPVYKKLESELNKIMFEVHIDDNQLKVYSPRIGDLIVRATTEIESISKSLYSKYGGEPKTNLYYDYDCIALLESKLNLSKKNVYISSLNCFQKNRILNPFVKSLNSSITRKLTFSWNNAYQNIKHDRANTIQLASIENLFSAMSALYLLNIYYKFEPIFITYPKYALFDESQGSDVFSVGLNESIAINEDGTFNTDSESDKYVFWFKPTQSSFEAEKNRIENSKQSMYDSNRPMLDMKREDLNLSDEQYETYISDIHARINERNAKELINTENLEYFIVLDNEDLPKP